MNELQTVDSTVGLVLPEMPKTIGEALLIVGKLMRNQDIETITMSRFGAGDCGESAEIDMDMIDDSKRSFRDVFAALERHRAVILMVCDSFDARVNACYDNAGGQFNGELNLVRNEDGHILLCEGRFSDHGEEQQDTLEESYNKTERDLLLADNLPKDKARKLIRILNKQDSFVALSYYGSDKEAHKVNYDEGEIPGEDGEFVAATLDELVENINSGFSHDNGGGGTFRFEPDGTMLRREFAFVETSTPGQSFDEKYSLRDDSLVLIKNFDVLEDDSVLENMTEGEVDQPRLGL